MNASSSWIIFLSVFGMILIAIEVFSPGLIAGIFGGICLFLAVILTFAFKGFKAGMYLSFGLIVGTAIMIWLWIKFFPKTMAGKHVILGTDLADSKSADSLEKFLGLEGKSITPLRPAGTAQIGGQRVDVVAESSFIEQETAIRVIRVEGNRVMVMKV